MNKETYRAQHRQARLLFGVELLKNRMAINTEVKHMLSRMNILEKWCSYKDPEFRIAMEAVLAHSRMISSKSYLRPIPSTGLSNSIRWFRVLSLTLKGKFHGTFPKR